MRKTSSILTKYKIPFRGLARTSQGTLPQI